ncbi:MAG: hypothetical protein JXK05_02440 [Campylobacterales bacterium]|nr:hypothetical protein [Campylobacterales bacterium]
MTHQIENSLHKIDQAFAQKDPKEVLMLYVMIAAVLFALSYFLFWESAEASFNATRAQVVDVQNKISADQSFLNANPPALITQIEAKTESLKQELTKTQEQNQYIKHQIEQISELYYDEVAWGEYINSISKHAKVETIHLLELSNSIANVGESFGHVLDITIRADAPYKNLLKFINQLEQSALVVDLHEFRITADKTLTADLNISVWGISY